MPPPLLYQTTQLIHLSGLPLDQSMKGVVVLGFLLYSAGMFLFARRIYGAYPALVAATVYVYAPYRLREAYIQGNYGQFSGTGLLSAHLLGPSTACSPMTARVTGWPRRWLWPVCCLAITSALCCLRQSLPPTLSF